jgi:FKBP-type peptidyl-prolyl cis-trans isomerase 2
MAANSVIVAPDSKAPDVSDKRRWGSVLAIYYRGRLSDGTVFDERCEGEALEVMLGAKMVPPGVEKVLREMQKGEERTVLLPPETAFGQIDGEGIIVVPRFAVPRDHELETGMMIEWRSPKAPKPALCCVAEITETTVTLDFNHPLAGAEVEYWLKLVDCSE